MKRVLSWKYSIVPHGDSRYAVKAQPRLFGVRVPLMPFFLVARRGGSRFPVCEFVLETEFRDLALRLSVEDAKATLLRHIWESGKHAYAERSRERATAAHSRTGEIPVPPWNTEKAP